MGSHRVRHDWAAKLTPFTFKAKVVRMGEKRKRGKRRCPMWCWLALTLNWQWTGRSATMFTSLEGLQRGALPLSSPQETKGFYLCTFFLAPVPHGPSFSTWESYFRLFPQLWGCIICPPAASQKASFHSHGVVLLLSPRRMVRSNRSKRRQLMEMWGRAPCQSQPGGSCSITHLSTVRPGWLDCLVFLWPMTFTPVILGGSFQIIGHNGWQPIALVQLVQAIHRACTTFSFFC